MDIHRCRFVDHTPSTITALAFSHPLPRNPQSSRIPPSLRLAIGRANGSIEIWNPQQHWLQETILHGGANRSIEGLVWTQEEHHSIKGSTLGRLFSIGSSTVVTEWDLTTGRPRAHFECNKGVVWSIAAQPRSEIESADGGGGGGGGDVAQELVVGCEDGSLVVISTEGGPGSMSLVRVLTQSRASRVLSLAYQTPHLIVAGTSDSKIRVFDTRSGRVVATMSVGQNAKQKDVHVWQVRCLPGPANWIVAGDSRGEITFWDGKRYSLRQRLKTHNADIQALATNAKGTQVFSAGIDRKTVKYELSSIKDNKQWTEVSSRKYHKHDVNAMAGYEAGNLSIIVSGGVDMTPIIIPLRQWGVEYHRTLPAAPQIPVVATAAKARLVVAHMDREVKIWRIDALDTVHLEDEIFGGADENRGRRLEGQIELQGEENIAASAVSEDGSLLAVSTIASTKLFQLRPRKSSAHQLRISKLPLSENLSTSGARTLQFTPDGRWICRITPDSSIHLIHIQTVQILGQSPSFQLPNKPIVLPRPDREDFATSKKLALRNGVVGLGSEYAHQIHTTIFSPNSHLLAVSDLGGWIDAFERSENNVWSHIPSQLPRLSAPAVAIGFRPSNASPQPSTSAQLAVEDTIIELDGSPPSTDRETSLQLLHAQHQSIIETTEDQHHGLFVLTSAHTLHEFDLKEGMLAPWSKRNPSEYLPASFTKLQDRASGMCFTRQRRKGVKMWIWGSGWVSMFDVERDLWRSTISSSPTAEGEGEGKKRKRTEEKIVKKSGAGGAVRKGEGMPTTIVKGKEQVEVYRRDTKLVNLVGDVDENEDEEEDEDMENFLIDNVKSHQPLPVSTAPSHKRLTNGITPLPSTDAMDVDLTEEVDNASVVQRTKEKETPSHMTILKYRPLLGFLPIGDLDGGDLEMAVVERPLTDVFAGMEKRPWAEKRDKGISY